jgi:CRISPR/Cas system CSM-associated protein Csm4 (group 5 of RAMP superfamily)
MEGTVLYFRGRTTSPFHTTRQEYANFLKSAPFIMGCTFRGAMLNYLIRMRCKDELLIQLDKFSDPDAIANFHRGCTEACPVKLFFTENPLVWFSFAQFEGADYQTVTRIGVARDSRSVAEGSIFNLEIIAPGSQFTAGIFLFGAAQELESLVMDTMKLIGSLHGIGRARSIGFGRFEVLDCWSENFERLLAEEKASWPPPGRNLKIVFETPYILGQLSEGFSLQSDRFAPFVAEQIFKTASIIREPGLKTMDIATIEAQLHPEFIGRFSYERKMRENRLVGWSGSSFMLHMNGEEDSDQLAVAAVLGIGPWNNWGFGRFHLS